ncbi:MAG: YafY family protein [Oscillospiraceae bacterium]|nr:YafY family protein [Oscillospiraceae bacterium]
MKIDRLVSIIMILLEKERIGAQDLARMFEVSVRTIYRDIDTINMAGIPVRATTGVGGGFEIMPEYKVDKNIFSSADLSAILMGLSNLSSVIRGDELVNALAKVKSFVPAERAKEISVKANQIYIDLSPWIGNTDIKKNLEIIKTAMQERKLLSFVYADRCGDKTARTAQPCQLVLKSSHWYWQGYCLLRNDFRLFKLSRTTDLQIKDESFTPRDFPVPKLFMSEISDTVQTQIRIRIHRSVMERVLDFCSFDNFTPDGDEHYIVRFPFLENDFCYSILLGFGDKCECLEPEHIRQEMKRRINDIAALYENPGGGV